MSIFNKIFSAAGANLISSVGEVVDNLHVSDAEKSEAKLKIGDRVLSSFDNLANVQGEVITEMTGNFLQRSWRPLLMLTFGVLLVLRWVGLASYNLPLDLELQLMSIVKIGVGGYVAGRSVEKVASTLTANIDMPFLKKKNR